MKTAKAIVAALLFSMLVVSGCATLGPAIGEHEEEITSAGTAQEEDIAYRRRIELWDFMGDAD